MKKSKEKHIPGSVNNPGLFCDDTGLPENLLVKYCGLAAMVIGFALALFVVSSLDWTAEKNVQHLDTVHVSSSEELILTLLNSGLWGVSADAAIKPMSFKNFPKDLHTLDVFTKKKIFFRTLLPMALLANEEIAREKKLLMALFDKIGCGFQDRELLADDLLWQENLTDGEIGFLLSLAKKYRTSEPAELIQRVDTVPVSLIMAQGAIESAWGGSRFTLEGNNLFGIWTWGKKGMIPAEREEGKKHRVASYDSLLDSIRAYLLILNRMGFYKHFRELRQQTSNSIVLAEGLLYYSSRRMDYVEDVRNVLEFNRLVEYDRHGLTPGSQVM